VSLPFHDLPVQSWGRLSRRLHPVARPRSAEAIARWMAGDGGPRLAVGARRSYGDTCLSEGARLLDMTALDCLRGFDERTGEVTAEAGVTLDTLLSVMAPRGWFVPVTPGTRFVTLGGAVANDVHGKNHARAGTIGRHVTRLVLERSDGRAVAVPGDPLFAATVGGLGLTGVITEVTLRLQRIGSTSLDVVTSPQPHLDGVCDALEAGVAAAEHNVAWVDCTSAAGRGIVTRADWGDDGVFRAHRPGAKAVPTDRAQLINPLTLKLFNAAYYAAGAARAGRARAHYASVFYPLDSIRDWNRLYGRRGFFQYQCVIPAAAGRAPLRAMLARIAASGEGSFLAVLKWFGDLLSPGLLSFPRAGWTLALDFRNAGEATAKLLADLDAIVGQAGGRLYPAKDARMPAALFRAGYPALDAFEGQRDPAITSDFWQRITP
jgi:FAD/FMN-containing dehydrogenase